MPKTLPDPHKTLIRLVGLNIALDLLSVPIWFALLVVENPLSTSTLTVDSGTAIVDAFFAVILFAVALLGLMNGRRWGAYLAVAGTVGQRAVGFYLFTLNAAMGVEFLWSALIVFFAFMYILRPQNSVT
jgi:hypothetical protein